jgi:carbonic anhydrase/acetyltransferase-like protein (isoleucine patch superfamily)
MAVYRLDHLVPVVPPSAWVADSAQVIGNVALGEDVSIWFNVVMRGDNERLSVGRGSNIQDGSVVHSDPGFPVNLGEDVTIGHGVVLHGCTVGDGSLIGLGAVVLNGAKIGKNCLVGAGSLVTEGKEFADGSLIVGSPAKAVRELAPEQLAGIRRGARHYVNNARRFQAGLQRVDAPAGEPTSPDAPGSTEPKASPR